MKPLRPGDPVLVSTLYYGVVRAKVHAPMDNYCVLVGGVSVECWNVGYSMVILETALARLLLGV